MMLNKYRNNQIYINFAFNILPFVQKVCNIDLNDEACVLNRKKKAAGTKMNALQGFGPHPNIRRASLRPEKSNFDRELGVCLCAFYCSKYTSTMY